MTSAQIRQSFLDFFRSKEHTIVPSSGLMPDSPNLLFTNAGMNQFVPIFLGERKADVSKWAGAIPGSDTRAADTQKCIRAGGKHNDLDDVGLDTYHHTFFEMLGNWSFGDYFKKEAIEWAWELVVERWKFPPRRLYATIYQPDKSLGDPSERDEEAWNYWAEKFRSVGLDPAVHIVNGNKKDNFWMMGDTGPCGPCSELHVDLTPAGDTRGALVNKGTAECIEIWNLVFIQFNANPDGSFTPLPAKHVDTGMGFERVTSIIQGTKGFADFANAKVSNYETDIFRPIFDEIELLSGKKYGSTLPNSGSTGETEQEKIDVAFRVIADHIRTLSFAVADGIQPGNTDRNYVLRRILRRAVKYGRTLGFHEPFFFKLVDVLAKTMGDVFPEIRTKQSHVKEVLKREEEAFNKTLDNGIAQFEEEAERLLGSALGSTPASGISASDHALGSTPASGVAAGASPTAPGAPASSVPSTDSTRATVAGGAPTTAPEAGALPKQSPQISAAFAFRLYDEQGFPLDLTELMARERGLTVDVAGFNALMDQQKKRSQAAQKKTVIELSQIETKTPTHFLGYDQPHTGADVQEVVQLKDKTIVVLNNTVCYAEMGGQVGDTGELSGSGQLWRIVNTQKSGNTWLHFVEGGDAPAVGSHVTVQLDSARRAAIQRHHTVTHLLHWAIHEVASKEASQKGSSVGPDKLTFDFNSAPLTPTQVADIEKLVNERILENAAVSWTEVPHADVKNRKDVMQFFGDKYGDVVRVVQIGGPATKLDGYSMELCGGTHTRATGEIGLFRILGENAIAAGVRRIEAVAGLEAWKRAGGELGLIKTLAGKVGAPVHELEKKLDALLAHQKGLEKALQIAVARNASNAASELLSRVQTVNGIPLITHNLGDADGDFLQAVVDALKGRFQGVIVLGGGANGAVALVAAVTPDFTAKAQAGKIIQAIAPVVGGKGGGKPDNARGGGKDATKLNEALAKVREVLG
ncbi:MAG TPA: alanine--tRNA ligase [Verrucomicrobiota bacterium]|nr:alanine--tRNA ligase [Verrucomicrobiota bacterium]